MNRMQTFSTTERIKHTNVNPNASNNHSWVENHLDVYNFVYCDDYDN